MVCPDFSKNGSCPRGKYCPLRHWRKKQKPTDANTASTSSSKSLEAPPTSGIVSGVPAAKEPYPLLKLRRARRHGDVNASASFSSAVTSSVESSTPTFITPQQLDFIPLDTSKGRCGLCACLIH